MIIFPAVDLFDGKTVRLKRGDYEQMTIYNNDPVAVAKSFKEAGATALHIVDLEGARDGKPVNFDVIKRIVTGSGLFVQIGGGIRTAETIAKYLSIGVQRVILGTAAVSERDFLCEMTSKFSEAIAVSADVRDGFIAIKGWTEVSDRDLMGFCRMVEDAGVRTLICTDISKDGLLGGANIELYRTLRDSLSINIIASGGVSSIDEVEALAAAGADGAIIGKALYTGDIDLSAAIKAATVPKNQASYA